MDDEILYKIIDTYGCMQQVDVAVEEMSELTKALMKYRRAVATKAEEVMSECRMNVAEELADVKIMLRQLELIFENEEKVGEWIEYKLSRQIARIENIVKELAN